MDFLTGADDRLVSLEKATTALLRSGYFDKPFWLVDYDGRTYSLRDVKVEGHIGPFWGFNLFLNRKVRIRCELEELPRISVEDLRKKIEAELKNDNGHLWGSVARSRLQRAATTKEVIDAFLG